jgi:hypothetical protein
MRTSSHRGCPAQGERSTATTPVLALSDNASAAGAQRQRSADDLGLDQGVHGLVRHPPALRSARHPHRPGLDRGRCSAMSRPNGHTSTSSETRRCCAPSSRWFEHHNGVRLHAGVGYVTPNDERQGRGPAIRKAREAGLEQARSSGLHGIASTVRTVPGARRCLADRFAISIANSETDQLLAPLPCLSLSYFHPG